MKIKYPKHAALLEKATKKDPRIKNWHIRFLEFIGNVTCRNNVALLDQIISEIGGWPTISKVGKEAAHSACLIVMFADHNVPWQIHQFNILSSFPKDEVDPVDVAFIEDRICINRNIEQIYGTQLMKTERGYVPLPIRNKNTIDARRHRAGLDTIGAQIRRVTLGDQPKRKCVRSNSKKDSGKLVFRFA